MQTMNNILWWWWIPTMFFYNILFAWLSIQNSKDKGQMWFWISVLFMMLSVWPILSKITPKDNLVLVSLIYDVIILVGFQAGLIFFGAAQKFTILHWVGLFIIVSGIIIFKLGDMHA